MDMITTLVPIFHFNTQNGDKYSFQLQGYNGNYAKWASKPQHDDPYLILSLTPLTILKSESFTKKAGFFYVSAGPKTTLYFQLSQEIIKLKEIVLDIILRLWELTV